MNAKIRRLTVLASMIALSGTLLLPALAVAQAKLVLWTSYRGGERTALEKVVESFNQSHDQIDVEVLAVPHDAYADKISAAVPRGKGPDIFIFAQDRLGGWVEAGNTIEPLDFFVEDETRDRFLPSTLDAMTYQGTLYGLPLNYKVLTMIYNKAIITDPPVDSTELVEVAKKHTDAAVGRYGLVYWYSDFYQHSGLMNAFGGGVFDADRNPTLDQNANVQSTELVLKWLNRDKILPAEPSTALITALFNGGKAAMIFNGPWFLGEISDDIDYGLAPLPKIVEAGGTPMKPWATVEGIYVTAPSEHKDEAYEFLKFITDVDQAKTLAIEGRQTPANASVYDDPKVSGDPILSAFRKQYENAVPMPNLPEMSMFWSPATTAMNSIVKGTSKPKTALAEAQEKVEEDVARLRGAGGS